MRLLSTPSRFIPQPQKALPKALISRTHATALEMRNRDIPDAGAGGADGDMLNIVKRYSRQEISDIYYSPLLPLVFRAANIHAANHDPTKIQLCTLMNIKSK